MFIIDFDDTLFDTAAFKHARLEALRTIGVSEDDYWKSYELARNTSDGTMTYSDARHAQVLGTLGYDEQKVFEALSKVTENHLTHFLAEGTETFLSFLKSTKRPLVLLSLGEPSFQEVKVRGAGIHDYFDRVFFVDQSKGEVLASLIEYEEEGDVWFVNDKVQETEQLLAAFPKMHAMLRKSPSLPEEQYEATKIPVFEMLSQIEVYVKEQLG